MTSSRDTYLAQPDEKLLAECTVETYRSSGPGGQHRNKRDSAVRLTHRPTGVVATATERRSQHENRHRALARLRRAIALRVREAVVLGGMPTPPLRGHASPQGTDHAQPTTGWACHPPLAPISGALRTALADPGWPRISQKSDAYLPAAAQVLDFLEAMEGKTSDVAASLGTSTASLVKFLRLDDDLWEEANRIRKRFGHAPLR